MLLYCHRSKRFTAIKSALALIMVILSALLATGCSTDDQNIKEGGTLKVITRNGPTTYFEGKDGPTGFEYELIKLFAKHLKVDFEIVPIHSLDEIFQTIKDGDAHIAAAGLTITEQRQKQFSFSPPYMDVTQYVVYHNSKPRPKSAEDLTNANILVIADSSHEDILIEMNDQLPELAWRSAKDVETIDLLDMIEDGSIDYTIVDSTEYTANKGFYPRIKIAFEVGTPGQLAWAMRKGGSDIAIDTELARFFDRIQEDGTLRRLEERFYSHSEQITQVGSRTFVKAMENKLPEWEDLIKKIAAENNIDWRLLAAISYQESHWNPKARSPTGVRGMMMLTLPTAREMNVKNRLDAEQSLRGGARYFNKILKRIPDGVAEPDRTWMALAAYNVGLGHLEDARIITDSQDGDPNKWADVKDRLPLLRKKAWYKKTKHGYARGNEPVHYVQNIRHFYDLIAWSEISKDRTRPPQNMDQYLPSTLQAEFNTL